MRPNALASMAAIALAIVLVTSASASAGDAPASATLTAEQLGNRIAELFVAGDIAGAIAFAEPHARAGDPYARSLLAALLRRAERFEEALPLFEALARERYENPPNDTVGWHFKEDH